ncbi:MAG TPA: hypothetical protein VGN11_02585 [Candidatus Baltobacteraceae bacterium]|jgi:hypothetical protein|nr:hypothetical protein [Candidatus Baltobacteraceae bacterium]
MKDSLRTFVTASIVVLAMMIYPSAGIAKTAPTAAAVRNGQHDFEFLVGHWKLHNRRLRKPLSGSHDWYEFSGVSQARTIWDGRGLLELVRFDIPNHAIDGLSLHFYDANSGQWSQYWATASTGLSTIPNVGSFTSAGVGVLTDHETINGRRILTRYRWTHGRNTAHWEQAFSQDEGKTWEVNWTTDYTRI